VVATEASLPRLVIVQPAERTGILLLSGPQLVIGHSESADLVIEDQYVSGRHALVTVDDSGEVTLWDLNSTGGTFVNGERVTGGRVLETGDEVRLADVVARFEAGTAASAEEPTRPVPVVTVPAPPDGGTPLSADIGVLGTPYTVTGTVYSPALPGIPGLTVQLVDKNVGGDTVLLPTTQTGSDGQYAVTVNITAAYLTAHAKSSPDLQVHVSAATPTGAPSPVLASSAVAYSAPTVVTLDVTLPAGAAGLPSEYEILTAALTAAYSGDLSGLQEGNGRADITYLAGRTGWDAQAVALRASASKLGQLTAPALGPAPAPPPGKTAPLPAPVSLQPEFYYALLRAGLPADASTLLRTSPADVQAIWEQATSQGVIPAALTAQIPAALTNYTALSASQLLSATPAAGLSTLDQMLQATLPDATQRQQFAQLYVQYTGNPDGLWAAVGKQFGAALTTQLQFTGQLYFLTINNESLVAGLLAAEKGNPPKSAADLATLGYYDAAKWAPLIGAAIPPSIPGGTAAEQAANYAELLAAQVRVSFPTLTLADKVRAGVIPVAGNATIAGRVADFLTASQATFDIGAEPVQAYLARTGTAAPDADVLGQVIRLQRARRLTPDDPTMTALLNNGLDSAYAITRYDPAGFTRAFSADLGGDDTAAAIYAQATQVFAATLSVAVGYLGARVSPFAGGQLPGLTTAPPTQSATGYPVIAFPTLENLFGSLDYCDCQDCGSILSPAAYLVDLLNYTDQPAPASGDNPQDVLLARRPDLQYLPLTCANTNTALPYIDLVNEALEYYVANGFSMAGYQGQDTGDTVTSAELIASPQYIDDAAYTALQGVFFPDPLPFTQPLILLRLQMTALGVALPDAMAALRASDSLTGAGGPGSYGWTDILIEQAELSRDEYRIFTDPSLQLGDLWGLPASTATTALQGMSLADLSRRLGVSYDDLAVIVTTQFINQNAALIPRLTRLNVSFAIIKELHDNLGTAADITASFIAALPAGLDATQYGGTSPGDYNAVVSWVTGADVYPRIMDIITITAPASAAADCSGADLMLRYANPDVTANVLTAEDYTRLIRFIRLWRKLTPLLADPSDAASIQHTDEILAALLPAAPATAEAGFQVLLQRLGFALRVMGQLSLSGGAALRQLLACWAPIETAAVTGQDSLYQNLFLTPAVLQQDPAFGDNGYGGYLTDADQLLLAHEPALCAACGLTGAEFTLITGALGFGPATPLTLGNVSAVFRFGWLARTLGLSVVEFIALRQYSGLDPFTMPDPQTSGPAEPAAVRFARLISAFTTAGLSTTQVLYLLWNVDLTGTSAPAPGDVTGLAAALRADFAAVEAQFTVQDDPTGAIAKSLVTLVYGSTAADFLLGLVTGTYTTTVPYSTPPGQSGLPAAVVSAAGGQLSYSSLNEQLSYAGVLDAATQAAIDAAAGGDTALQTAVAQLATASQQAVAQFLAAYPDLTAGYDAYLSTAGSPADKRTALLAALLPPLTATRKQEQALATVTAAAGADPSFASALLTAVAVLHADGDTSSAACSDLTAVEQQGLSVRFFPGNDPNGAVGGTADATGVLAYGPALASQLPPGANGPSAGVWDGYLTAPQDGGYYIAVAADPGAAVTLIANGTPVPGTVTAGTWQNQLPVQLVAGQLTPVTLTVTGLLTTLSVSWQGPGVGWQLIPGQYLYSGTLVARLGDTYTRYLKAVSLADGLSLTAAENAYLATALSPTAAGSWLNDLAATGTPDAATAAALRDVLTGLLGFSRIKLALSPASPGDGRLLAVLQDPGALLPGGQSALASLTGWAQDSLDALLTQFFGSTDPKSLGTVANFTRVDDASAVVAACGLSAAVLVPTITNAPTPDTVSALQAALRSHYAEQDWLTVIKPVSDAARVRQRDALVARILARLGDGYTPPTCTLTTTAAAVVGATTIECTGTTGVVPGMTVTGGGLAPGTTVTWAGPAAIAVSTGVPAALPAGTALSATVTGNPYDTPDSLLAPFLVDVQTQPPVLTSRIRLALSQVQLFIERVIRNLEPAVSAGDFDPTRWDWMKRYRLWQANREVFLWPENWLFPELRDDQSPLFEQVMGSLLQGDITDDAAAGAYLDYLSGLEEVAKLEPCGLYYQPGDASVTQASYVVARTKGAHRKHFFRELTDGGWGPWTQMMIDPEDMPVTPVVWAGRLLCCWLKAVKQAQGSAPQVSTTTGTSTTLGTLKISDLNTSVSDSTTAAATGSVTAQVVLCWAEYYNGKWQPTKTSDVSLPTTIGAFDQAGDGSFEAVRNQLRIVPGQFTGTNPDLAGSAGPGVIPPDALILAINAPAGYAPWNAGFILHNTNGAVRFDEIQLRVPYTEDGRWVFETIVPLAGGLDLPPQSRQFSPAPAVPYTGTYGPARFTVALQDAAGNTVNSADLLQFSWLPRVTDSQPGLPGQWTAPFLYEDHRRLFYVTTTQSAWRLPGVQVFGQLPVTRAPIAATSMPPLVLPPRPTGAAPGASVAVAAAGASPSAMQRYLAQTPGMRAALPLPAPVTYQGQVIYPAGSLAADAPALNSRQGAQS